MKISERLLLVFLTAVFCTLLVLVGACVWNEYVFIAIASVIASSVFIKIAVSTVFLLLIVLSIRSMFVSTGKEQNNLMAAATQEGGIYINIDTVSELASRAVKKVESVREIRVKTVMSEEGANILVKASLAMDAVIPEVSVHIQQSVKSDIEALCGIAVKKVIVQIDNSLQSQK